MGKLTFSQAERLKKQKHIEELFHKGSYFYLFPFKVLYLPATEPQHQVLISVSKRQYKRAVDRNTVKRRIREGYRLNKALLPAPSPALHIGVIYTHKEILESTELHRRLRNALQKLAILHPDLTPPPALPG